MTRYIIENGEVREAQAGDVATHALVPIHWLTKTADRARLAGDEAAEFITEAMLGGATLDDVTALRQLAIAMLEAVLDAGDDSAATLLDQRVMKNIAAVDRLPGSKQRMADDYVRAGEMNDDDAIVFVLCRRCNDTGSIVIREDTDGMGRRQPHTDECPGIDGQGCPALALPDNHLDIEELQ